MKNKLASRMKSPYELQHSDFSNEVVIICPHCGGQAFVKGPGLYQENTDELTYAACLQCGHNQKYKDFTPKVKLLGGEVDPFFHHPLWYSTACLEGVVWAYNLAHLEVIESFIGSIDRSRHGLPNKNNSIASRLPKWMSTAKSRVAMLKCIRKLKGR